MDTKSTVSGLVSSLVFEDPEEVVSVLETCAGSAESGSPKRLRTEQVRSIVELIVRSNTICKEHLERIITSAVRSSECCWEQEEQPGIHAIEARKLARLYDSIAETAERRLAGLR